MEGWTALYYPDIEPQGEDGRGRGPANLLRGTNAGERPHNPHLRRRTDHGAVRPHPAAAGSGARWHRPLPGPIQPGGRSTARAGDSGAAGAARVAAGTRGVDRWVSCTGRFAGSAGYAKRFANKRGGEIGSRRVLVGEGFSRVTPRLF